MGMSALRARVTCVLVVLFPFSLFAADSNAAMLYTHAPAWVNGSPGSAALFGYLFR
jgi:hypothetical protein